MTTTTKYCFNTEDTCLITIALLNAKSDNNLMVYKYIKEMPNGVSFHSILVFFLYLTISLT